MDDASFHLNQLGMSTGTPPEVIFMTQRVGRTRWLHRTSTVKKKLQRYAAYCLTLIGLIKSVIHTRPSNFSVMTMRRCLYAHNTVVMCSYKLVLLIIANLAGPHSSYVFQLVKMERSQLSDFCKKFKGTISTSDNPIDNHLNHPVKKTLSVCTKRSQGCLQRVRHLNNVESNAWNKVATVSSITIFCIK